MIYHYTSIASLDGIIREDSICLRATHYQHLNDRYEVAWCQDSLRELRDELKDMTEEDFQLYKNTPYIISLCNSKDDFNMWRLYGDNGRGIMLCFDYNILKDKAKLSSETTLGEVLYANKNERKAKYKKATKVYDIETLNDTTEDAFAACAYVKNDAYSIENEVRFVVIQDRKTMVQNGEFYHEENKSGVKHRMRGSELVPFIEVKFPIGMLKSIVVGYELDYDKTIAGITQIFKQYGEAYHNVHIEQSVHSI